MEVLITPKKREFPTAKCNKCATVVQLESYDDLRFVPDYRDGDYYVWICPTCKYNNSIDFKLIPNKWEV